MNKYIITLVLAAVGGTAMAQLKFQPKHPGIIARQILQSQQEEVSPALQLNQRMNKVAMAPAVADEEVLQLDSITITQAGELQRVRYHEYHSNGNMALQLSKQLDINGNWVEMDHIEWTEDYPLKGSSETEYGYDDQGVYGGLRMKVWDADDTNSFTEYKGANGQWKPTYRLSTILNEQHRTQSEAFYKYDEEGNEEPDDSIAYTYNQDGLLELETYFFADENGQLVEVGSFITTYDEVDTPSGTGVRITTMMSDEGFKRENITSADQNYLYYADYVKGESQEWEKDEEHIQLYLDGDLLENAEFRYQDNALVSGKKMVINTYRKNESDTDYIAWEYSCTTDSTQWLLLRQIEDFSYTTPSEFGREDLNHQTFITLADENGELHEIYDVFLWDFKYWTAPYTLKEEEYYDGEQETGVLKTYYYHDASSTAITDIQAQPQNARAYTLFGTEAGEGYRGIVIRGGKKVAVVTI